MLKTFLVEFAFLQANKNVERGLLVMFEKY